MSSPARRSASLSPSTPGNITEYNVPGIGLGLVAGPDGNIWFTEASIPSGRSLGSVRRPARSSLLRIAGGGPRRSITVGPDQNLWFTDDTGKIGTITIPAGAITEYAVPNASPTVITSAPDGNLWFTAAGTSGHPNVVGVVTLTAATIPTQLAVTTQPPAIVTSGNGFGLVVTVENAAGVLDRDYTGTVTIALENNPGSDTARGHADRNGPERRGDLSRADAPECRYRLHDPGHRDGIDVGDDQPVQRDARGHGSPGHHAAAGQHRRGDELRNDHLRD